MNHNNLSSGVPLATSAIIMLQTHAIALTRIFFFVLILFSVLI